MGDVVFLILSDAGYVEAFHEIDTLLTIAIDDVIDSAFIATLEDRNMEYIRADEEFFRHTHDLIFTILMEDDDVIYIGAVKEELIFLESCSDESFLAVDIEFLVVLDHRLYIDSGGMPRRIWI